ncbi:type VI secretion system baseplate subunit TssF [Mesorhizobium koreense]|jgi:type VI secretion system protein ImpG|uniref:type VI secretion system baseplate subunit TssF n=1 Tax=Mesorhizobium koreense TaxID=3074855 RepID=UPI00287B6332|nr:type VI secretion system baseplate subunit TssF [Mesorhizobium sp. WR6]
MTDDILGHYNRELLNIRRAAAQFAAENPRIASRLRLSEDAVEDPHVGRLIESFAFLTARIRQRLDDDFTELANAMLAVLYPHYTRPFPSMAILQIEPGPDIAEAATVPRGTLVDTEEIGGESCRFSTAFDVTMHPVRVVSAALSGRPIRAPEFEAAADAAACLRLTLETSLAEGGFSDISPASLRFFLRGQPQLVYPLYEMLLNDVVAVAFAAGANDAEPVIVEGAALTPGGFDSNEGLLPYPDTSHAGYRLLTEYFAFPEKFLFVDLAFPDRARLGNKGRTLDVFIYLRRSRANIERAVTASAFALNCTPVANLFRQAAEPISLDHTTAQYTVEPDSRRSDALEIYSIEKVVASDGDGNAREVLPVYGTLHTRHSDTARGAPAWWIAHRHHDTDATGKQRMALSIFDPDFTPSVPADTVLSVDTLCFNGNLAERLPFGGGRPELRLAEPMAGVEGLRLITAPTPVARPDYGEGARWRLISHLALNHLSIVSDGGLDVLKEMLLLYDIRSSDETRSLIDGISALSSRPGTARLRVKGNTAFCRGIDVTATFDEAYFSGNGIYMAASVLERFFGMYASVNSFARLSVRVKGQTGVLKTWPARGGDRILL